MAPLVDVRVGVDEVLDAPSIVELIEEGARGTGSVLFAETNDLVTTRELWADAERYGRWIRSRAGSGGRIGAFLDNRREVVTAILGIWRSGNTLVSLPHRAPRQEAESWREHVERMCTLADVRLVFAPGSEHEALAASGLAVHEFSEADAGGPTRGDHSGLGDIIQFTSGSTSNPKGVVLSARAIGSNVAAIRERCRVVPEDVAVSWLPLSHDMGLVGILLTSLASSSSLVMMTPKQFMFNPARWLRTCSSTGATVTVAPNFAFDFAVRAHRSATGIDLSRLRMCMTGSERVSAATLRSFAEAFASSGFDARALTPAYGMAECSLAATIVDPDEHWTGREVPVGDGSGEAVGEIVSNGRPVDGIELRVDRPVGGIGELQLRGGSLLEGYLGAASPWTEDGWYRTRDLGFVEDGECFVIGRTDEVIVIRGCNYFPEDFEAAAGHESLRTHGVAAVPWQHGGLTLIVEVAKKTADFVAVGKEIASTVGRRTGIVPSLVTFVGKGALPRTPSGKIQRTRAGRQITDGTLVALAEYRLETP